MNSATGTPEIGRWYARTDTGNVFQVTGLDDSAGTIEIQSFGGDIGEVEARIWPTLPLETAPPPEQWLALLEDLEAEDLASSRAEIILQNPRALEQLADNGSGIFAR